MAQATSTAANVQDISPNEDDKREREQSTISFPYQDLNESILIAKAVHELHGSSASFDQIAAHLKQSPTSSSFRVRIAAAKVFTLISTSQGNAVLTSTGSRICDSQQEKAARAEAFLAVPLYREVYEKFKGAALPPANGLEATMGDLGVAQKQRERARQLFQRSAQQAGFFQFGNDRLVMPAIKANAQPAVMPQEEPNEPEKKKKSKDTDTDEYHPFIQGLLKKLPEPDTEWTMEARAKWLQTAANIFDLMYTDSEDSRRSINIGFQKDSAK